MSIYNEDELVPPTWINQEFLQKVLKEYENNETVQIDELIVTPASVKGDHYGSIMFRSKVAYTLEDTKENKIKSLIIKTLPEEECFKRELLNESGVFETEISMFSETLPLIEKILNNCGEPTKLAAEVIYTALEPHKLIIFEDLCQTGFDVVRGRQLTVDEMKMVYKKIAKMHAVTYMLGLSEEHEKVTKYQQGLFSNSTILTMDLIRNGIGYFIKFLEEHEELAAYLEKVKQMEPVMLNACCDLYNAFKLNQGQEDIFVLNHGDFHMKNLMFRFSAAENGQTDDVIFVDYQMSCYAPSSIDLIYTQYQMLSPDLRLQRHEFMLYYFEEFIRVLKKIGFQGKLPKYSDFQIALLRRRHLALFLLSTFLPMFGNLMSSNVDDLKDIDVKQIMENTDVMALSYNHPNYLKDMRRFLPILLKEGYLD
ncbi:hypothetical protein DOY81_006792 [Sarcophaga bullata]|nr:hypothetical protein DOY81_006792 [Sarcophaga bullata]